MPNLKLYIARREARLTAKKTAELIHINERTYRKKEAGESEFTLSEARQLAKLFNRSLDELFSDEVSV